MRECGGSARECARGHERVCEGMRGEREGM